ncbi:CPBP family intramembrane glutamic endopeptidase [Brevibacillus sp. NRS-1366]|uniref:CPBP family intramembrane glutamic endopeptidase n=1 Tax=Brevibacillus sp. NRS-1366 TaxID=3233899 RepID=UPI003D1D3CDC
MFAQYAPLASWTVIFLALLFALINAPLEELLWRGVFPDHFPHHPVLGFLYPTICFGLWHFAPALAKDSGMDGGLLSFAGGAFFMGSLWGWYAYRYKTILPTTVSHVFTNFFAFTGFLYVNWFS